MAVFGGTGWGRGVWSPPPKPRAPSEGNPGRGRPTAREEVTGQDASRLLVKELAPGRASPGSRITEFPIPTVVSYPWGITAGSDGNLWFTEQNRSKIGQITTAGALRESRAKPGLNPEGITSGPDGNIWFTAAGDNAIVEFRML